MFSDYSIIIAGLQDAFTWTNLMFVVAGVCLGQFVGAVPGLSAPMAIAIAVPLTFVLSPLAALSFLIGVGKGGTVGGAIPAILINTPGTPDAAATALDGHPLARQGKPQKALKMALYASVTGDTMSDIVLILVTAPLAVVALKMGPVELAALMVLTFTVIAGLVSDSFAKGMVAIAFGLLCAAIGLDPENGTPRLQFGIYSLYDGLSLTGVAIGVLAVSEVLTQLAKRHSDPAKPVTLDSSADPADRRVSWAEYWACRMTMFRGGVIGTIVGALPGIGSSAAAFMSYGYTKNASKDPSSFGKGNLHGIAACESANSAVMGANMIPLLTLGIPGNVTAALLISAFVIHGVQPGPLLFTTQGQLIYGLFGAMMMGNVVNLFVGQVGLRLWAQVVKAPAPLIFSASLLLCITGVYVTEGGLIGVVIMLVFGLLGCLMRATGFSPIAFIIAFILGESFELSMVQSRIIMDDNPSMLMQHPIAIAILALAASYVIWMLYKQRRMSRLISSK